MKIAALMTCYNRAETTLRCLKQLVAQELPPECLIDIYLVDDASPDQTGVKVQEWFSTIQPPTFNLHLIRGSGSLFWCKGMRLAWDTAITSGIDYDYWLWLNDDIQLYDGAVRALLDDAAVVVQRDGKPGIIVGTFVPAEDDHKATYGLCNFQYEVAQPDGAPRWVDGINMNGNLVLIPREICQAVGPIYGGYYHGSGDTDYRLMAKKAGFKAYCSSRISGICPRQPERYISVNRLPLRKRIASLFSPLGMPLHDTFVYRYRHWGVVRALVSSCHVIYLATFPRRSA